MALEPHLTITLTRLLTDEKGNSPFEVHITSRTGTKHVWSKSINGALRAINRVLLNFKHDKPLFALPSATLPSGFRPVARNLLGDGELT